MRTDSSVVSQSERTGNDFWLSYLSCVFLLTLALVLPDLQSDSHLRQMKIFSENASGIMDSYSKEFEKVFLDTLRMRHGTTKMMANRVYQEVIQDKQHVHMNATIWATLSDFCKYLGKLGKCVVEETERGWMITYIERDVAKMQREEALARRLQAEQEAEKAAQERMERQRREQAELSSAKMEQVTNLQRTDNDPAIKVALQTSQNTTKPKRKGPAKVALGFGDEESDDDEEEMTKPPPSSAIPDPNELLENAKQQQSFTAVQQSMKRRRESDETKPKEKKKHKNEKHELDKKQEPVDAKAWLHKGIVVRIINRDLAGGKYFRRKAVVDRLVSSYTAELTVLEPKEGRGDDVTGDVLQMDQEDIETVVPKRTGVKVRLLRGPHRGRKAKVKNLDKANYTAQLKVDDTYLDDVDFADFAEIA